MEKGKFIVIEGPDGCGKSTHAKLLSEHLKKNGRDIVVTQEPTKGPIGQMIRQVLKGDLDISPEALTLLFTADRAEHVKNIIKPALDSGKTVISDRYYYSTVAYQSVQKVSENWISQLNSFVPEPDLVMVLEIEPKDAMSRIEGREKEVFEVIEFQEKVQQKLLDLAYSGHDRLSKPGRLWKVISSKEHREDVQDRIREFVDNRI